MIRRKTMERLLADQQRAHQRDRGELIALIRTLNEQMMLLAGRQWAPTPLDVALVEPDEPDDEERFPDLTQVPEEDIQLGW